MDAPIHPTALAGWSGQGAVDYEVGRPGYPRAAVQLIGSELGVGRAGPRAILDLAAGTGKLTRELGILGVAVIAVEPVAAMRAQLEAAAPTAQVLDGTAERIPLGDGAVRAVTVAQAFHWFDVPRAAAEIVRVLDPGGGLAIVRNEWDDSSPESWEDDLRGYIHEATVRPETHERDWRSELDATDLFTAFSERVVANERRGDLTSLLRQIASMSFIAALPDDARGQLLDGAESRLRDHGIAPGVEVTIPTRTVIRWARPRP